MYMAAISAEMFITILTDTYIISIILWIPWWNIVRVVKKEK